MVGGGAALGFTIIATLLTSYGHQPWVANSLSYGLVMPLAYLGQKHLTFESSAKHISALPRYVAIQLAALLLSAAFAELLFGLTAINPLIGFALIAGVVASMNYLIHNLWTFAHHG